MPSGGDGKVEFEKEKGLPQTYQSSPLGK